MNGPPASPRIVLVGLTGAGKTAVGRRLALRLGRPFLDLDEEVEREAGTTITSLFAERGESGFREMERDTLRRLLDDDGPFVLATGGGAPLDPANRDLLRARSFAVWLRIEPSLAVRRMGRNRRRRPLLNGEDPEGRLRALLVAREPLYREVARLEVDSLPGDRPDSVAARIQALLAAGVGGSNPS